MAGVMRFRVRAVATSQTLPRLINYFSQRDLTPHRVIAHIKGKRLTVTIEQLDIDPAHAALVAEKMRAAILVESVELSPMALPRRKPSSASAG